jgi:phosphoglycolate phosphatase
MLLDILAETGIDARESLMVGDTTFDMAMAAAAGMDALAVTYGAHPVGRLVAENPRACVDDFGEVVRWIRSS